MLGGGVIQIGLGQCDDEMLAAIRALPAVVSAAIVVPQVPATTTEEKAPAEQRAAKRKTPAPIEPTPTESPQAGAVLVKIETKRSQDALVQVIGYLNERDVAFTSIEIFEPNLESVFLHLTGKKLRE
jgi:hypothetical protein